jgi:hypothetical protein
MIASAGKMRKGIGTTGPQRRTFCRIVGEEIGPDGKKMLLLEPITAPQEQQEARARYKEVTERLMRRSHS